MQVVFPSPALHADAVVPDRLALRSPLGLPVYAFAWAWFEPSHARGPRVRSVFSAFYRYTQCVYCLGVLEEVTQGARGAVGFHAGDAARVGNAGEDVLVGLEDREQACGLL